MNVEVLIDSIVRQTTVLIAQLATSAGGRAPLAHTANQVFLDLTRELKEQGLGNKVIADMFGLALRTYHAKVRRLTESGTFGGRSLWETTLEYVQSKQTVQRADVLQRFRNDDPAVVRSILKDLVETGIVFQSGRGDATTYRAATLDEVAPSDPARKAEGFLNMVWVAVNRYAPARLDELLNAVPAERSQMEQALAKLAEEQRITASEQNGETVYTCGQCLIPLENAAGWEAAVFDHYQALVTAICTKLRRGTLQASHGEAVGGSTYGYEVWPGHPHFEASLGLLSEFRHRAVSLRERIEAYNVQHTAPANGTVRVIAYVGQTLLDAEDDGGSV